MALKTNGSQWRLLRYARFIRSNESTQSAEKDQQGPSSQPGTWKHSSWSDDEPLMLSIQDSSHLLITRGRLILESLPLFDAEQYIKAAFKGDCILFMQRIKNDCRKFRVKLMQGSSSSTVEACADCVAKLRTFFQVRYEGTDTPQVLLGGKDFDFPLAYHNHKSSLVPDQLAEAMRLCLSDPTFPAFIESVDEELKKIIAEG